MYRLTYPIA